MGAFPRFGIVAMILPLDHLWELRRARSARGSPTLRKRCRWLFYLPGKKDGSARSRIVCRPGVASSTFGMEFTAIEAVATSPWMPPDTFIDRLGEPSISTESYVSGDPRNASMWSLITGSFFR